MNEVFNGGETVHRARIVCAYAFHSGCYTTFGRGGGTYAS